MLIAVSYFICVCPTLGHTLFSTVRTNVSTEILLSNVSIEMQKTHRFMIKQAIFSFGKIMGRSRREWIDEHVGMVCVAAINVWFTTQMEDVFRRMDAGESNAMHSFLKQQQNQLADLRTIGIILFESSNLISNAL